jgi:hypothetical protein
MPLAPGRLPDGLVAALRHVLEGERPARDHLPRPGPRDVAATPARGFHIAFSRPGLRLAPIGTAAYAVGINPWAQ